jgi:hypothetical protein
LIHRRQGKAFFFEKKKQKAFVCAIADLAEKVRVSTRKSFLVLFLEKGLLACYESWSRPAGIRLLLFCKKEGKNFCSLAYAAQFRRTHRVQPRKAGKFTCAQIDKSLFASFSSEKAESLPYCSNPDAICSA